MPALGGALMMVLAGCTGVPSRSVPAAPPSVAPPESVPPEAPRDSEQTSEPFFLDVAAVGDIMMGTDYPQDWLPPDDGAHILAPIAHWLKDADIAFGNLEGVLLDGGTPFKRCAPGAACYVFRTPSRYVKHLVDAGFKAMSVANNHARDFGESGRGATIATLTAAGIYQSGRAGEYASWEVKGRRVAMVAFAPYGGSNNMLDLANAVRIVKDLAGNHDFVIVSFHGGAEGSGATRVPLQREFFHGEDRGDVAAFAHAMVDAGAALVIGHGPHVPRAMELYKDRLIAYSLGNFATYLGVNVNGANGLAPVLRARLAEDGSFVSGRIHSARQIRPGGPVPDSRHEAAKLISGLTRADFPSTPLIIDAEGNLARRRMAAH